MIIIGEKINATRKTIATALDQRDEQFIIDTAVSQADAGADYIDLNGGDPRPGREAENMKWLVDLVQANTDKPLAIDSANPEALDIGLSMAREGSKPILNSISLETDNLDKRLEILAKYDCMVVGLEMSDAGLPSGVEDRLERAAELIDKFQACGKQLGDIIIDPCFFPVSSDVLCARAVIDAIAAIHAKWPEVHIGGGCSNISFGLPKRKLVNFAGLAQAIYQGMDVGLIDPCIPGIMAAIFAAEAVAGKDEYCMNYINAERDGVLG
ncbi:MAG: dihydropteroate synthase, partial [Phycisphaerae bacterium]|jgi:5-methyltetrahydrofolate--homocysteine methyltransferase|nr:dihydropteroate synthase [Phycisphaerae bacterium]